MSYLSFSEIEDNRTETIRSLSDMPLSEMLILYNRIDNHMQLMFHKPGKTLVMRKTKNFRGREHGIKITTDLINDFCEISLQNKGLSDKASEIEKSVVVSSPVSSDEDAPATESVGRQASCSGKRLYLTDKVIKGGNPRQVNSYGWKSMNVIISEPGILFDDFLKKGGRSVDLNWDIKHGNAIAK